MKEKKLLFSLALASLVALTAFAVNIGHGQAPGAKISETTTVKPSALMPATAASERPAGPSTTAGEEDASLFGPAVTRNTQLRYDLSWAFGGKQQRGWYLYVPLISRMIKTEGESATLDFASALARWQKSEGLAASGVLDGETLYRMVAEWQGSRLKDKTDPRPEQLMLAPSSDFYDLSRPEALRNVERETYAAYKRMVAAALEDPSLGLKGTASGGLAPEEKFLKIVSAHRSREYQAHLRRQSPNSGRAGLAVNSPHFTGRALDIYVGGEPVETKDSNRAIQVKTAVYLWLVRNADKYGFRPYYYEPWHWEYVGQGATANK